MKAIDLIENIKSKNMIQSKNIFESLMTIIATRKLLEAKKSVAARMEVNEEDEETIQEEVLDLNEARIRIIKARIRGGKIQRRKKVSNVAGYTLRGGKLKRMSMTERRKRRMGQRRGKLKRRAKLGRALMKRKRSLRRRKAMGL